MDKKSNDTFAFDLENRLDDFFNDSLPPKDDSPAPKADFPLKDLKSTILAIDWEITDDALDDFLNRIDELAEPFKDNKVNQTLLRILKSLGKYIRTHKSKAHPETIKRIMAVFAALEESVTNDELSRSDKEKMLLEEVRQFKRLKAKIVESPPPRRAAGSPKPIKAVDASQIQALFEAVDQLKSLMASELGAIRKELQQLRKK